MEVYAPAQAKRHFIILLQIPLRATPASRPRARANMPAGSATTTG
jgi:hypothetical protein